MQLAKNRGLYEAGQVIFLTAEDIEPSPSRPTPRSDEGLLELAASIRKYGVLRPLTVRRKGGRIYLMSGSRRLAAAKLAGLSEVPCVISDQDDPREALAELLENLRRRDIDFIEEAEGLSQLVHLYGMSQEEAARRVGRSQPAVANKLRLLKLPQGILYILREANLSELHARALLRLESEKDMVTALERIIKREMTVAQTEEYIDEFLGRRAVTASLSSEAKTMHVFKDVRRFINSISRGMAVLQQAGIAAEILRADEEDDIVLTIRLPRK